MQNRPEKMAAVLIFRAICALCKDDCLDECTFVHIITLYSRFIAIFSLYSVPVQIFMLCCQIIRL